MIGSLSFWTLSLHGYNAGNGTYSPVWKLGQVLKGKKSTNVTYKTPYHWLCYHFSWICHHASLCISAKGDLRAGPGNTITELHTGRRVNRALNNHLSYGWYVVYWPWTVTICCKTERLVTFLIDLLSFILQCSPMIRRHGWHAAIKQVHTYTEITGCIV